MNTKVEIVFRHRFSSLMTDKLFLLFFLNVNVIATRIQNITSDISSIGVILDMTSRVGKEARVAMGIAIDDFNIEIEKNLTLYTRNSRGNFVQAIHDATDLIDTHKVGALLGLQTLEEVVSVGEIVSKAQIPTLSLLDSIPQWALDRFSFLVQAPPSQFAQMKAFVAILESCGWNSFTFIYEDINSESAQVIPHLMEAIKESSGVQMSNVVRLSSLSSSSFLSGELGKINTKQCRVFLVHASLEMGINIFQNAKSLGMMEKGYVWITTNLITDLLHTVNSFTFSIMEGVVGLGSFFPENDSRFHNFSTKFQKRFKIEQPEEEINIPGIFAVQAYDATWTMALALNRNNMSGQKLLDELSAISLTGITGKVQFVNRQSIPSHIFQIVNVIGKYYRQLGFWSEGLGFSKVVNDRATYNTSLQYLGHIFWPGKPLHTPRGWAIPSNVKPLRVGVPTTSVFKKFVEVKYDHNNKSFTVTGYSIELFKETVKRLPYYLPYEFHPFTGSYDSLVEQVYLKNFDAVVGDVSVVSNRYQYAEFTHPYTETGLMMVVPITSHHQQWLFMKPFTFGMWAITILFNIYNALVIYLIERKHCPELQGSFINQIGVLLSLAFTRTFSRNSNEVHSNLTRMTTVTWIFAALIIGQCYTASLTSMLTIRRMTPQVTDFETLKNAKAVVGCSKGSHVARYLEEVLGFKNENLRKFGSPEEYADALKNRQIAAFFLEIPTTKLFLAKYCKSFTTAGTTFRDGGFGFVLPKGSPMVSDFTKALLNVSESRTLQDMEKAMLGSEECVDQDTIHDEYGSLGLSAFWSLFLLTGGTSTIALATYVIISLSQYYQMEGISFITIVSDIRKYTVLRRKRLSRKVSDLESPNALEMT